MTSNKANATRDRFPQNIAVAASSDAVDKFDQSSVESLVSEYSLLQLVSQCDGPSRECRQNRRGRTALPWMRRPSRSSLLLHTELRDGHVSYLQAQGRRVCHCRPSVCDLLFFLHPHDGLDVHRSLSSGTAKRRCPVPTSDSGSTEIQSSVISLLREPVRRAFCRGCGRTSIFPTAPRLGCVPISSSILTPSPRA